MEWGYVIGGMVFTTIVVALMSVQWNIGLAYGLAGGLVAAVFAALVSIPLRPFFVGLGGNVILTGLQILIGMGLVLVVAVIGFWRDPERIPPDEEGIILSAADGVVAYITRYDCGTTPVVQKGGKDYTLNELAASPLPHCPVNVISVDMNLLDVHVNRCPVFGRVKELKHTMGEYLSLRKEEAPFLNSRATTVIENRSLTVVVVQIASRLVRRIDTYLVPSQAVTAGQRLGMIKLGSLVAVILPEREDVKILVKPGDRVQSGLTVIARYNERD